MIGEYGRDITLNQLPKRLLHYQVDLAGLWVHDLNSKESEAQETKLTQGLVSITAPGFYALLTG
jgi:hypothetical protein